MIKNNFIYYYYKLILFCFFPAFIIGVAATNYIALILMISVILLNYNSLYFTLRSNIKFIVIFLLFYLIILISSLNSNFTIHSLKSSLLYFLYLFYIFSFIVILNYNKKLELNFLFFGMAIFLIVSFDGFVELIYGRDILGNYSVVKGRIAGFFNERWVIGSFLIRFLPILVGIFFCNISYFNKYLILLSIFTLTITSIVIIYSGERVAFLLLFLYLMLNVILILKTKFNKYLILFLVAITLLFTSPFFLNKDTNSRIKSNIFHNLTNYNFNENQYLSLYGTSLKMFIDKPFLGVGPNNFRNECKSLKYNISNFSCSTHPHNYAVQLLGETGIFGFFMYFSVFIYSLVWIIKFLFSVKADSITTKQVGLFSFTCGILINFWPLIPSGNFFLSWLGYIYFLPFVFLIMYKSEIDGSF